MPYIGSSPSQVAFLVDTFSGNGSTTAFTTSVAPANTASVLVAVSGVLQDPSTYSVSGTTLTFSAAPPSGTGNISARYLGIPASGVTTTAYRTITEFTATAGQTTFTPPSYTVGFISVYRNGVLLGTADYTASNGTTVVLATGATAGDLITTQSFYVSSVLNAIPATAGSVSPGYLSGNAPQPTVYTSGSGTYTTPSYAKSLWIRMVGGGGGGGGVGLSSGPNGSAGGTTTFNSINANGGSGGTGNTNGPNGGAGGAGGSGGSGSATFRTAGSAGIVGPSGIGSSPSYDSSGSGGPSVLGGGGATPAQGGNGNTGGYGGGGSGGGGVAGSTSTTGGGGGGEYVEIFITSPASSYSYSVGSGGAGGVGTGTNAATGGAGGSGVIYVVAYF